jgi:hypothetical protein
VSGILKVILDGNVFDELFFMARDGEDLCLHLRADQLDLFIVPETKMELLAIPGKSQEQHDKIAFFQKLVRDFDIKVVSPLPCGFADPSRPGDEERWGGFDDGIWLTDEEYSYIQRGSTSAPRRPTGLSPKEGDAYLAMRSVSGEYVILTSEKVGPERKKAVGPIQHAYSVGKPIISMAGFNPMKCKLWEFLQAALASRPPHPASC